MCVCVCVWSPHASSSDPILPHNACHGWTETTATPVYGTSLECAFTHSSVCMSVCVQRACMCVYVCERECICVCVPMGLIRLTAPPPLGKTKCHLVPVTFLSVCLPPCLACLACVCLSMSVRHPACLPVRLPVWLPGSACVSDMSHGRTQGMRSAVQSGVRVAPGSRGQLLAG